MTALPFSQACENNKDVILEVLQRVFADSETVLEIASGTGQHATHFAAAMPWLRWQPTELPGNLPVLAPRCAAYAGQNLQPPLALDVRRQDDWPQGVSGGLFTANSLHIMAWASVEALFSHLGDVAQQPLVLAIYGPFNYGGRYTSESNAAFDQWLAQQHPDSAIRDFEAVDVLATSAGFSLLEDNAMPANNRLLVWRRQRAD